MAGFREAGAHVEKTADAQTGEFRISWNTGWMLMMLSWDTGILENDLDFRHIAARLRSVDVECKRKSLQSVRDRQVAEIYRRGTELIQKLMKERSI